ncbi:MAG: hypothetical protein P8Q99_06410 [Paracoccaceae bacterium]|nr:hypothetical protein [Paracoccaceae bacterium]
MSTALLSRAPHRPEQSILPILDQMCLARSRVHELCGVSRRTLALTVAQATTGPIFWLTPGWQASSLNAEGVQAFIEPSRLITVTIRRAEDLLWSMEECLRSGAGPLVIADLPGPPALTPVRRLHLAAETGTEEGRFAPLGLILTPGAGGAQGVESRWSMDPQHTATTTQWQLDRRRHRSEPPKTWPVAREGGELAMLA